MRALKIWGMTTKKEDAESLPGMPGGIEVSSPEGLDQFAKLPLRAAQIGALLASGFTCVDIDNAFALTNGTARQYKSLYFTKHDIVLSPQVRDKIVASFLRAKSIQLVSSITPTVIDQAGLGERVKSAALLMDKAIKLEQPDQAIDIGKRISSALSKLASHGNKVITS